MHRQALTTAVLMLTASCLKVPLALSDGGSPDAGADGLALQGSAVGCPDSGVCIFVDPTRPRRVVPGTLFGDQMPNLNSGTWLWDTPSTASCAGLDGGTARPELMALIDNLGLKLLRYPGGTPSDFFHWQEAIGPTDLRTPQIDPFQSSPDQYTYYCPTYGPDEFAQVARELETDLLITPNVGTTGSEGAAEAAAWLRHYQDAGVRARFWEIGNENYLPGFLPDGGPYALAGAYKTPTEYAALFNAYAASLRAVDPTVQIGAIINDQASWNSVVVAGAQRPDFFAIHIGYAPSWVSECYVTDGGVGAGVSEDEAWRSTLSASLLVRYRLTQIEEQIAQYAPSGSDAGLALTEHGSDWTPCSSDLATAMEQLQPNYMLAGALYSATLYNLLIADPRVVMANHINVTNPFFQAAVRTSLADGYSSPVMTPYARVFQLYAQSAGALSLPSQVNGSPTYDALVPFGGMVPVAGVPSLDAVAVEAPGRSAVWIYVVNRHLSADVTATVALNRLQGKSITAEILDGATYDAVNSPAAPNAVAVTTSSVPLANPFTFSFPAHSLTRLVVR